MLGPPASGKGTQAEMLQKRFGLPVASPGAMFREEKRLGLARGEAADELARQGKLVSDEMVNSLVAGWIQHHTISFVFDGYPRSIAQAEALKTMLQKFGSGLDVVLSLELNLEIIRERVDRRWMCSACGQIVRTRLHPGAESDGCPACKGRLIKRRDDSPETLAARMSEYAEKTEPLISYYGKSGILREVDASGRPELVFQAVTSILEAEQ